MADSDPHGPSPVAAWRFVPAPRRPAPGFEEEAFRSALLGALRTAHGAGVEVALRLASGPDPVLALWTSSATAARWVIRALSPAYGANQWVPYGGFVPPHLAGRTLWVGRRRYAWPEPLGGAAPFASTLDRLGVGLATAPPGAALQWTWRPLPAATPLVWDRPPLADPPALRPETHRRSSRPEGTTPLPPLPLPRPLFGQLRVAIGLDDERTSVRRLATLRGALESLSRSDRGNGMLFRPRRTLLGGGGMTLTVEEWAQLWPTPWSPSVGEAEVASAGAWRLPLGRTTTGRVVGPPIEPTQGRHLAVLGETGMGKSSLLVAIAHRAFRRAGGVVLDPLGDTAQLIWEALPSDVRARAEWVAPRDSGAGVNALEGIGDGQAGDAQRSERRLNDIVHALRRVRAGRYEDASYWGPRLEEMVTRAVRAAAALPRGTLLDAHTLLAASGRLGRPVPAPAMDAVRELADRIRDRPEDADGARRLLHEVVRSPVLVRMLCETEPRRSARGLVAPGRIVLISGDAAEVGDTTARYLLSVYLAMVWSELLAREEAAKTYVILDEAQWFSHESLAEMLRLGRRRNVHVVLATQAVRSLPQNVAEAVWTNVSDFVAFRGAPEEAREFSRASRRVTPEELLALPRGHAAALLGKGNSVRWIRTSRRPLGPGDDRPAVPGTDAQRPVVSGDPPEGESLGRPSTVRPPDSPPVTDPAARVLVALACRAEQLGPDEPLVVPLDELRKDVDSDGDGIRRAGSILGRNGMLERSAGGPGGTRWTIPPERLPGLRALAAASASEGSGVPQPS